MSEEGEKAAEAPAKKGKMGLVIGIVIAAVTLVGGSVAGAVLGPRLLGGAEEADPSGKHAKSEKGDKSGKADGTDPEEGEAKPPEKLVTFDIPSIVVDLRDSDGRIRHLKIGLTAELGEHVPLEEFKLLVPRGREAAITYLRSLSFEQVSDAQQFVAIKDELGKRVIEALGEGRAHRIVLTDFVVQ